MYTNAELSRRLDRFLERIKRKRQEELRKEQDEERELADKRRQDYLERTGRKEMKP